LIPLFKKLKRQKTEERIKAEELWEGGQFIFVFSSWNGKPLHPSSVKTWRKRFTARKELPYIRFHDLRHTSGTLLLNQGVHMKTISARLGHSNILTTMNIYGHALESADREAANKFELLF
jgi:integrase